MKTDRRTRLAKLGRRARSLRGVLAFVLVLTSVAPSVTEFGPYLNDVLFFQPMMHLRAAVGKQPQLQSSIRLVLADDRSVEQLGRLPTFADWQAIGETLLGLGYERIILLGAPNLRSELGETVPRTHGGAFAYGAVVMPQDTNPRARAVDALPVSLLTSGDETVRSLTPAVRALVPKLEGVAPDDRLGHLNLPSSNAMLTAYAAPGRTIIPSVAYLGLGDLAWREGRLQTQGRPLPASEDGTVTIDYVTAESIRTQSVPAFGFFTGKELPLPMREKLAGGRIAVLIPDAFTGSRFVDAPLGKVLAFHAVVSVMSAALEGRLLYRPVPYWYVVMLMAPLLFWILSHKRPVASLYTGGAITLALAAASAAGLATLGWILPCAQLVVMALAAILVRASFHLLQTAAARSSLQKDLELGREVQRLLLPKQATGRFLDWEFRIFYRPYSSMAGDWFQIHTSGVDGVAGAECALIAIGDVVGKGASAALSTAVVAGLWNNFRARWADGAAKPRDFLRALNETMHGTFGGSQNSTLSLASITRQEVRLQGCGSPFWLHFKADGSLASIVTERVDPLGMLPNHASLDRFGDLTAVEVAPGEILMAYTDGVIDGPYSSSQFRRSFKKEPLDLDASDVFETLVRRADAIGATGRLPDDFTVVLIRRLKPAV